MDHFTPVPALIGGLMIGSATVLYLFLSGRYAGISGILRGAAFGDPDRPMDVLFVVGLLAGGALWFWWGGHTLAAPSPAVWWPLALGGLLVGFGTSLGGGCTSGHGVCGLGRLSLPSLAAVIVFIATGILTVFLTHHVARLS